MDDNNPDKGIVEDVSDVDAIADILDDPETDTGEEKGKKADEPEPDDGDEPDEEGDESEDDSVDDEADDGEDDKPTEYSGGRFAADDARVKLPDGSTVTVGDLKAGSLRQDDYTRKTQSLAEERKTVEAAQQRANQVAQQLQEHFERITWQLEQSKPQRPEVSYAEDPIAHGEYQDAKARWDEAERYYTQQREEAVRMKQQQDMENFQKYRQSEMDALVSAIPDLRDDGKREKFARMTVSTGKDYGFSEQEVRSITDHRMLLVLKDAANYSRLMAKAPKTRETMESKPQMLKGSKRSDPKQSSAKARRQRTERLQAEGTMAAGIAALMDEDL